MMQLFQQIKVAKWSDFTFIQSHFSDPAAP